MGRSSSIFKTLRNTLLFGLTPVLADRERVSHVFDNLIGNALAHTHTRRGGEIDLAAGTVNGGVGFTVKDTGEGIPAQYQSRVFERFFRIPGSRAKDGAGLGLAIAREIVVAHGGQIGVTSQEGVGTTFTFSLPISSNGDGRGHDEGETS